MLSTVKKSIFLIKVDINTFLFPIVFVVAYSSKDVHIQVLSLKMSSSLYW